MQEKSRKGRVKPKPARKSAYQCEAKTMHNEAQKSVLLFIIISIKNDEYFVLLLQKKRHRVPNCCTSIKTKVNFLVPDGFFCFQQRTTHCL